MTIPFKEYELTGYDLGKSAVFASQTDQRFSYCVYVPSTYKANQSNPHKLLTLIHGSDRENQSLRDHFIDFAEDNHCIILAPLFPCGITDPSDTDNYKYIQYKDIRFDQILLAMVEEISAKYRITWPAMDLFGFSGGAHFVHRFLLLHPEKVANVSIASPGSVTLIDSDKDWWVGTGDMEARFGKKTNLPCLRDTNIHLTVGENDTNTDVITHTPGSQHWMKDANSAGVTRVHRIKTLYENFKSNGLNVSLTIVPSKSHDAAAMCNSAIDFFSSLK